MDRSVSTEKYRFNEVGHVHQFKRGETWFPLIGVTTALGIIAKPALIPWAVNIAIDHIKANSQIKQDPTEPWKSICEVPVEVLEEARTAHSRKKVQGGQAGTNIHNEVEQLLNRAIGAGKGFINSAEKSAIPQIQKFIDWAVEGKVKFLESEKHVFSEKLWIGGILDMVIEWDGKILIADIKTGAKIYNEAFFQMGAYDLCLEEMGVKIDGYLVINLKKDGGFELEMADNREINKRAFLSALELYKISNIQLG